jgi:hypothetical protein
LEALGTDWSGWTTYGISFSTRSVPHPIVAVTAPVAPRTLRNSRRLTPADPDSVLMRAKR